MSVFNEYFSPKKTIGETAAAIEELRTAIHFLNTFRNAYAHFLDANNHRLDTLEIILHETKERLQEMMLCAKIADAGQEHNSSLSTSIDDIDLGVRARSACAQLKIETLKDIFRYTRKDFESIRNFGRASMAELEEKLATFGIKIPNDPPKKPMTIISHPVESRNT